MKIISFESVANDEDDDKIVWHNFNMKNVKEDIYYYNVRILKKEIMKLQIIVENEFNLILGIGILKIIPSMMIISYLCKMIFEGSEKYKSINTYLIKGDYVGEFVFKCAGFMKAVVWRKYVKINEKKYDVIIYSKERE